MYHIKPDKRSQSSAAEIARGLEECLKTKSLKAVTVSDIHRVTGISRATFYRLFDTPEDVLHYEFEQMLSKSAEQNTRKTSMAPREIFEQTIAMGMERHELLKALVDNGRFDLLYQYTEKSFRALDASFFMFSPEMEPIEREYTISHLSMAMVATLITWAKNGRRECRLSVKQ